jgi:hypothetical protein
MAQGAESLPSKYEAHKKKKKKKPQIISSRMERMEERISKLEDRTIEISHSEILKENTL